MRCDRIDVMYKGEVIEQGNHEQLNEVAATTVQEAPALIGNSFIGGVN